MPSPSSSVVSAGDRIAPRRLISTCVHPESSIASPGSRRRRCRWRGGGGRDLGDGRRAPGQALAHLRGIAARARQSRTHAHHEAWPADLICAIGCQAAPSLGQPRQHDAVASATITACCWSNSAIVSLARTSNAVAIRSRCSVLTPWVSCVRVKDRARPFRRRAVLLHATRRPSSFSVAGAVPFRHARLSRRAPRPRRRYLEAEPRLFLAGDEPLARTGGAEAPRPRWRCGPERGRHVGRGRRAPPHAVAAQYGAPTARCALSVVQRISGARCDLPRGARWDVDVLAP
jgi:hypothetical protein